MSDLQPQMTIETPPQVPSDGKKNRHGCLTAYLIFMILANTGALIMYLVQEYNFAPWVIPTLIVLLLSNITVTIALFMWKRWGFLLVCFNATASFVINLIIGVSILQALMGFVGIGVLYGVLQIGKNNKGWPQLD
ncbi:MAG TPA: hypothetical protein DIW44_03075 [Anaerolineaceae bacterium]|nr:hypothetical protein [Anaerolineaceae bacterium]